VQPRRGFLVSPLSAQDIRDTFAAQALLAGEITARAAAVATAVDLRALETLQTGAGCSGRAQGLRTGGAAELRVPPHHLPAGPGPRDQLAARRDAELRPREFFAAVPGWPEASAHDHHAVLTALRNLDSEAAREAMSRHVTGAGALLAEHLARPRGTDQ